MALAFAGVFEAYGVVVVDGLVGETALALEDMAVDGMGKAELRGSTWSVRNVMSLSKEQRAMRVDGVTNPAGQLNLVSGQPTHPRLPWRGRINGLTHLLFGAFLVLSLSSHGQHLSAGPFNWGAPASLLIGGFQASLGLLSLLPLLVIVGWLASRILERPHVPWRWGRLGIGVPLLALTILTLTDLGPEPLGRNAINVVMALGLVWFTYLLVVNRTPNLTLPLALVVVVQGGVAIGQYLSQSDLGLAALGEVQLRPSAPGTTVLWADGRPWLRAYGLTAHPNQLGAILTVLVLFLLPAASRCSGWTRTGLLIAVATGYAGLLVTFSRASWLAFAAGLLVWIIFGRLEHGTNTVDVRGSFRNSWLIASVLFLVSVAFVALCREQIVSRLLRLDSPAEALVLSARLQSTRTSFDIILADPWRGVGAGNYADAARSRLGGVLTVHNVPLLVTAELGLPGAILWLWIIFVPFKVSWRSMDGGAKRADTPLRARPGLSRLHQTAPWVAYSVLGLFDYALSPLAVLRGAILLGLLLGQYSVQASDPRIGLGEAPRVSSFDNGVPDSDDETRPADQRARR